MPSNNKDELRIRERYYIESIECINKNIPGRTHTESVKAYRESNRDIINEKQNTKFTCECGGKYSRPNKNQHLKSKKHLNAVALLDPQQSDTPTSQPLTV